MQHPIIIPIGKEAIHTVWILQLEKAALYSAAMGSREVTKVAAQNTRPPPVVNLKSIDRKDEFLFTIYNLPGDNWDYTFPFDCSSEAGMPVTKIQIPMTNSKGT